LTYDIDGKYNGPIPLVINPPQDWWNIVTYGTGALNLPELSEGKHRLTISTEADEELYSVTEPFGVFKPKMTAADGGSIFYVSYVDTVYFTIDSAPPNISILSPQNNTYTAADIPLNFTLDEQASNISYSLDGNNAIGIEGNTTLNGLSIGEHNLTVYASDAARNIGSQTIQFTIANPTPTSTPAEPSNSSSTAPIVAASAAVAAGSTLGVLAYLKYKVRGQHA
jgi:hypothetical protein